MKALAYIFLLVTPLTSISVLANTDTHHQLPEFKAKYAITKYDIKLAEAVYVLKYTHSGYEMTQHTSLYGMAALFRDDTVSAKSIVDKAGEQLLLKSFSYRQTGKEKDRDEGLLIKYRKQNNVTTTLITGVSRKKPVSISTQGAVWDILSFQIPLMIEATDTKTRYPYMAVINGELGEYTFILKNKKQYDFAGKTLQLLQMVRSNKEKTRELHIWLAPTLHNLPVIVENYRDGNLHSRMQLESVQFDHEKPIVDDTDPELEDF